MYKRTFKHNYPLLIFLKLFFFIVIYLLVFVLELRDLFLEVYLRRQAIVFLFLNRLSPVDINPINDSTCILIIVLIFLI